MTAITAATTTAIDLAGGSIDDLLRAGRGEVDALLPEFLQGQRWFARKDAVIEHARIGDVVALPSRAGGRPVGHLAMVDVTYADGTAPERYATALAAIPAGSPRAAAEGVAPLATVHAREGTFLLADAVVDREVAGGLVDAMRGSASLGGQGASLRASGGPVLDAAGSTLDGSAVAPLSLHSSNTSVRVTGSDGIDYALKLVRRHDGVLDPETPSMALDVWKGAYLTNEAGYANTPPVLGAIDHIGREGMPRTVGVLTGFVDNQGDSWGHALAEVRTALAADGTEAADAAIDSYARTARTQGRRLGELHVALAGGGSSSEFRGVARGAEDARERVAAMQAAGDRAIDQLRAAGRTADADLVRERLAARIAELDAVTRGLPPVDDIHVHGDFHLGQMLRTGDDVQIIDLEGAPALPLAERWKRASALTDVARQRSSYEYAAHTGVREAAEAGGDTVALRQVADRWARAAKDAFLDGWLDATSGQRLRHARTELGPELRQAELDNALYETSYELGSRPDWVDIPLGRLRGLLD